MDVQSLVNSVNHWHHKFEIAPGIWTPGSYDPEGLWRQLALPSDMTGMRVLDIGASDGFFTAKCYERGSEVVAVDYNDKHMSGFHVTEQVRDLNVEHMHANLWDLPSKISGSFDIVLFLGVLYHLPDPCRALHILRNLCEGTMYLETVCWEFGGDEPLFRFCPDRWLNNDRTNFWLSNPAGLQAIVEDAGFDLDWSEVRPERAVLKSTAIANADLRRRYDLAYGLKR